MSFSEERTENKQARKIYLNSEKKMIKLFPFKIIWWLRFSLRLNIMGQIFGLMMEVKFIAKNEILIMLRSLYSSETLLL